MDDRMEEIDLLIKDTLSKEEALFYDSLEEQNLYEMVIGLFQGKNAWILIITNIMTILFLVFFVYCCIQFVNMETTEELIRWGFCSLVLLIGLCMLKIYAWMQMDKNAMLREMKRMELLVMSSAGNISKGDA